MIRLSALALAAGAAVAPAVTAPDPSPVPLESRAAQDGPFAPPEEALRISADAVAEMTLHDLLVEFCSVTGEEVHATTRTREKLRATPVGLLGGVTVPPAEVYAFIEHLLFQEHFLVADLRRTEPRLLAVHTIADGSEAQWISGWRAVDAADLGAYADHPALLVEATIDVAPLNAQHVSNSLRGMLRNNQYQSVYAVGDAPSVVVRGTGRDVAGMARLLGEAVAHASD
jgi:hypothetical protein